MWRARVTHHSTCLTNDSKKRWHNAERDYYSQCGNEFPRHAASWWMGFRFVCLLWKMEMKVISCWHSFWKGFRGKEMRQVTFRLDLLILVYTQHFGQHLHLCNTSNGRRYEKETFQEYVGMFQNNLSSIVPFTYSSKIMLCEPLFRICKEMTFADLPQKTKCKSTFWQKRSVPRSFIHTTWEDVKYLKIGLI